MKFSALVNKKKVLEQEYDDEVEYNDENFCPNLSSNSKKIKKPTSPISACQKSILRNSCAPNIGVSYTPIKIYGMFQTDEPCEIEEHAVYSVEANNFAEAENNKISNLMLKVRWMRRSDGSQPESTWYRSNEVKSKCPHVLLAYYEKYIRFSDD